MATDKEVKKLNTKKTVLYSSGQTPPMTPLIFSSLQHMLLVLSLGMAMPVSIARAAGLDLSLSSSLLASALFCMGFTGILQTIKGRFIGSGNQSLSVADTAALSACILAAEIGGIPLVLGMTIFSGILRFVLGSFIYKLRRFFPAEVTGTMIFILGINVVPTALKSFLGSAVDGVYNPMHLLVAVLTLLFMLSCTLFIKPLKPYTALLGIVFGFILSIVAGVFDMSKLGQLPDQVVAIPVYAKLSYSFDVSVLIPFVVVTVASVVDNIGGFSAVSECAMDDRRIFVVFLSIAFAISTLIPGLYSFLPDNVASILVSPMVMGVCVLLITTLISRIGTKKTFSFVCGVAPGGIIAMNDEIEQICRQRGTERALMKKMQIAANSICEAVYEFVPQAQHAFVIRYDPQQIWIHIESQNAAIPENMLEQEDNNLEVCMLVLNHMFESVKSDVDKGALVIDLKADL